MSITRAIESMVRVRRAMKRARWTLEWTCGGGVDALKEQQHGVRNALKDVALAAEHLRVAREHLAGYEAELAAEETTP